jgi:hypothetical protein
MKSDRQRLESIAKQVTNVRKTISRQSCEVNKTRITQLTKKIQMVRKMLKDAKEKKLRMTILRLKVKADYQVPWVTTSIGKSTKLGMMMWTSLSFLQHKTTSKSYRKWDKRPLQVLLLHLNMARAREVNSPKLYPRTINIALLRVKRRRSFLRLTGETVTL